MTHPDRFLLAGVMGWPVMHSRSPMLHNYWFRQHNLTGTYVPLAIRPEGLAAALRALQPLGFAGCNLTIPHKQQAMTMVDEVDTVATRIGAISCVVVHTSRQAKQMDNILPGTPHVTPEHQRGWWHEPGREVSSFDDLGKLVSGMVPGRRRADEITCFVNNVGIGLQFAAAGALVLERARAAGAGQVLPEDWFSEDVHP